MFEGSRRAAARGITAPRLGTPVGALGDSKRREHGEEKLGVANDLSRSSGGSSNPLRGTRRSSPPAPTRRRGAACTRSRGARDPRPTRSRPACSRSRPTARPRPRTRRPPPSRARSAQPRRVAGRVAAVPGEALLSRRRESRTPPAPRAPPRRGAPRERRTRRLRAHALDAVRLVDENHRVPEPTALPTEELLARLRVHQVVIGVHVTRRPRARPCPSPDNTDKGPGTRSRSRRPPRA